ncbi:hypothetical protein PAHAL_5G041500 [Panicum hallii]|uniref:Uncharacterized protein n=1 Tax=Panicum hallii TaxID=206008 RepID=A0A2T8IIV9_9POAL|nr:hypothetical protein PAHAL_5G041500 [Panicum hallii]
MHARTRRHIAISGPGACAGVDGIRIIRSGAYASAPAARHFGLLLLRGRRPRARHVPRPRKGSGRAVAGHWTSRGAEPPHTCHRGASCPSAVAGWLAPAPRRRRQSASAWHGAACRDLGEAVPRRDATAARPGTGDDVRCLWRGTARRPPPTATTARPDAPLRQRGYCTEAKLAKRDVPRRGPWEGARWLAALVKIYVWPGREDSQGFSRGIPVVPTCGFCPRAGVFLK